MKITFVLPAFSPVPIGGYKVVYEYANRLSHRGHHVRIAHLRDFQDPPTWWRHWTRFREEAKRNSGAPLGVGWFPLSPEVDVAHLAYPRLLRLHRSDVAVATSWRTAVPVAALPRFCARRKAYLLQHVEDWDGSREDVLSTWKLPLSKIVISRWLGEIARDLGESSIHVPNGIDFEEFGLDVPPVDRTPDRIAMLWHDLEWKGSRDGLAAITKARESHPGIQLDLFGTNAPPADLPDWVTYHRCPSRADLRAIYNRAAIFVGPSHNEGWGLPPSEAMACGCACVLSDIGGHREFAENGRNALLFPARAPDAATQAILRLLESNDLRMRLAESGLQDIARFTWDRATDAILDAFRKA